jgi:hypothetical protein
LILLLGLVLVFREEKRATTEAKEIFLGSEEKMPSTPQQKVNFTFPQPEKTLKNFFRVGLCDVWWGALSVIYMLP